MGTMLPPSQTRGGRYRDAHFDGAFTISVGYLRSRALQEPVQRRPLPWEAASALAALHIQEKQHQGLPRVPQFATLRCVTRARDVLVLLENSVACRASSGTRTVLHAQRQQMSNGSSITQCLLLPFADTRELQLWHFWLFLGISLAALLGNGLIITSTACDQHLHTPMDFFLLSLSLLDLGCISTAVPKSKANSLWDSRPISYTACAAQIFFFLFFLIAEFYFLTIMSYDHYVAICKPVHYRSLLGSRA
ncbi:olfactory receptor 14I1-like [Amazona ochrocephala]